MNLVESKRGKESSLSIIMPCYKGEGFIEKSIERVEKEVLLFGNNFELVVVIDGFVDEAFRIAKELEEKYNNLRVVGYERNKGKGYAIKYGLDFCQGEYIAFLDSDLDYHPKALGWFLEIAKEKGVNLVVGNRRDKNSTFEYPLIRKLTSYTFNIYVRLLFPELDIEDTQAGIKLLKRINAEKLFHYLKNQEGSHGFIFDIYLLVLAKKLGLDIFQAPCIFQMKTSTIGMGQNFLRSAYKMGRAVWKFKKNLTKDFLHE